MATGKRPYAPSSKSLNHVCPTCQVPVHVTVGYKSRAGFEDAVEVRVFCPGCKDATVTEVGGGDRIIKSLVKKLGTRQRAD